MDHRDPPSIEKQRERKICLHAFPLLPPFEIRHSPSPPSSLPPVNMVMGASRFHNNPRNPPPANDGEGEKKLVTGLEEEECDDDARDDAEEEEDPFGAIATGG